MSRLIRWVKSKADHNAVSYSRFGLPGEETDDRPQPTEIFVASFDETSPEFMICGIHSQRLALISAGIGMSLTLFIFISVFFEFDWYHHQKGVDIAALGALLLLFSIGILIHYQVIAGIRSGSPRLLVPFMIVYTMLITTEAMLVIFFAIQLATGPSSTVDWQGHTASEEQLFFALLFYAIVIGFQSGMLLAVARCRNFLAKKQIHEMEMRVAHNSKAKYPGIQIVVGLQTANEASTVSVAAASVSTPPLNPATPSESNDGPQPTRTLFETVDER